MRYFLAGLATCILLCLAAEFGYRAGESFGLLGYGRDYSNIYRQLENDALSADFAEYLRQLDDPFAPIRKSNIGPQNLETTFTTIDKFKNKQRTMLRPSGQVLCDVTYEVDSQGRRKVPNTPENAARSLLIMGASPVFGTCLKAEHTLTAYLQQIFKPTRVYNLGMEGIGPNDALAVLEERLQPWDRPRIFDRLEPKQATVVFVFNLAPGFERMRCAIFCYQSENMGNKPFYALHGEELRYEGKLKDAQIRILAPFIRLLGKSRLLKAYSVDVFPIMEKDMRLLGAIMREIRLRLGQKVSADRYLFVLDTHGNEGLSERLKAHVESAGWEFIALNATKQLKAMCTRCINIPYDHHPTPQYNWIFARLLAEKLGAHDRYGKQSAHDIMPELSHLFTGREARQPK